jgi:hypothetical protein
MKNLCYNLDCKINQPFSLKLNNTFSISEQQILELQDLFLTNGIHHISVPNLKEGRALMYKFLDALRCYQSIACFTIDGISLKKCILDLHSQLLQKDWDHFFIEEFTSDFLWIEHDSIIHQNSLLLEEKLCQLGFDQQLPIIILLPYPIES